MTLNTATLPLAIACLLVAGAASAAGTPVTADDFKATHAGKCVIYTGPTDGKQCFGADGSTSYDDKTYGQDTGKWKTQGDEMCVFWKKEPGWSCGPLTKEGNVFSDGEYTWTIE